jgi:hypothetical protein
MFTTRWYGSKSLQWCQACVLRVPPVALALLSTVHILVHSESESVNKPPTTPRPKESRAAFGAFSVRAQIISSLFLSILLMGAKSMAVPAIVRSLNRKDEVNRILRALKHSNITETKKSEIRRQLSKSGSLYGVGRALDDALDVEFESVLPGPNA